MKKESVVKQYHKNIELFQPKSSFFLKGFKAFMVGGFICLIGQLLHNIYLQLLSVNEPEARSLMLSTLILCAALLTGVGVFDRFGKFAGAGALVPVTGFTNAMASSALEHKSEGLIYGVGANMFKLTGAVIAFGVLFAYIVSLIRLLIQFILQ